MKTLPIIFSADMIRVLLAGRKSQTRRKVARLDPHPCDSPYGWAGDKLWVREAFARTPGGIVYKADDPTGQHDWISPIYLPRANSRILLKIEEVFTDALRSISKEDAIAEGLIYQTGVPFEDVHVYPRRRTPYPGTPHQTGAEPALVNVWRASPTAPAFENPIDAYQCLWDSLAKPEYRWEHNPMVWVVKFSVG